MNTHVFLHKGYFWSAGKQYGWPNADPGIGIALSKIKEALPHDRVYVKSKYDYLSISAKIAMAELKKYNSIMHIGSKGIGVLRKSRFVKEGKSKEERLEAQLETNIPSNFTDLPLFKENK